jgi:hypothetical protein
MVSVQGGVQQQMVTGNCAKNGDATGLIEFAAAFSAARAGAEAIPRLRK